MLCRFFGHDTAKESEPFLEPLASVARRIDDGAKVVFVSSAKQCFIHIIRRSVFVTTNYSKPERNKEIK
jgi:hypothetical protein